MILLGSNWYGIGDGVGKTLHPESRRLAYLLRHYEFTVTTAYPSTLRSNKFTFLAYEVFSLSIQILNLHEYGTGESYVV